MYIPGQFMGKKLNSAVNSLSIALLLTVSQWGLAQHHTKTIFSHERTELLSCNWDYHISSQIQKIYSWAINYRTFFTLMLTKA